jgi:hypothetical protein
MPGIIIAIAKTTAQRFAHRGRRHVKSFDLLMISSSMKLHCRCTQREADPIDFSHRLLSLAADEINVERAMSRAHTSSDAAS